MEFPVISILHCHGTFVQTKRVTSVHYYSRNCGFCLRFISFSVNAPFQFLDANRAHTALIVVL